MKLTKPDEDKLVAFAGIAKRTGGIDYYNNQYFAGFFMRDLPTDLAWVKAGSQVTKKNQEIYRAPTWSWASLDSSIGPFPWDTQALMTDPVALAEVRSIHISYVDPTNRYGQIKAAQLVLLGSLIPCRIGAITMYRYKFFHADLHDEAEPSELIGDFRPDMREGASYEGMKFACPIVECHWRNGPEIRGIVVHTTKDGMFYERLGHFSYRCEGVEGLHYMIASAEKQVITVV